MQISPERGSGKACVFQTNLMTLRRSCIRNGGQSAELTRIDSPTLPLSKEDPNYSVLVEHMEALITMAQTNRRGDGTPAGDRKEFASGYFEAVRRFLKRSFERLARSALDFAE